MCSFFLSQLSNLGIMTARLLPALQECFKSEYVSVRIEAAMVTKFCRFTTFCDKLESRFPFFSLPLAGEPDLYVIGYYYHYHHHHLILLQLLLLTIHRLTDPLCKIFGQFQETIDHIATGCPELAKTECLHNSGSDKSPGTNVERAGEIYTANPG